MPIKKPLSVDRRKASAAKGPMSQAVDWEGVLARITGGKTVVLFKANSRIFRQGDPADSQFYIRKGKVKLSVRSEEGKEGIIAILDPDEFFAEGCLVS
jgi:CRP/FNR family transcriptional regulator, cyclic AMP receptor protein